MSLEQTIHERWSTDYRLGSLLNVERLSTGAARGATSLPYAVLSRHGNEVVARTSSGTSIDRALVRFTIWTADLDQGKRIAEAIGRRFDRTEFAVPSGRVLNMQRKMENEAQADDGSWRLELDYTVLYRSG